MTRRYYVPNLAASGGLVSLGQNEAAHLVQVMRASVGDEIELFDGLGHQASAMIETIDRRNCLCIATSYEHVDRESPIDLHLGVALPKPDRAKELVERLTELGVVRLSPMICERTQREPRDGLMKKLDRIVIESSKQCGRNVLMKIDAPARLPDVLNSSCGELRLSAHPGGTPFSQFLTQDSIGSVTAIVGPEGGFSDKEIDVISNAGFQSIDLGKRILRIETAAAVMAAMLGNLTSG